MSIYTGTGDSGETGLFGGGRVSKADARVAAYGAVDELNAAIGWAITQQSEKDIADGLRPVQSDLFAIGGRLATPPDARSTDHLPPLPEGRASQFETWIDHAGEELEPLDSFVLPGGSEAAAALHLARTVCRRAERAVVALAEEANGVDASILVYLNRLSDVLFQLARLANHRAGVRDTPWRHRP